MRNFINNNVFLLLFSKLDMLYKTKPENFNPKLIVVSAFLQYRGKFLLLKRNDSKPEGNTWGMPAGKIDKSESIYEGVIREVHEETGVKIGRDSLENFSLDIPIMILYIIYLALSWLINQGLSLI
jgi:8-oxo-dGTP pyrophosphatase MutT (NUDIX family)